MFVHKANQGDLHLSRIWHLPHVPDQRYTTIEQTGADWVLAILQHPKHVFHHHVILYLDQLCDLLGDPSAQDRQVDFTQVDLPQYVRLDTVREARETYLVIEIFLELGGFDGGSFLVFKPLQSAASATAHPKSPRATVYDHCRLYD